MRKHRLTFLVKQPLHCVAADKVAGVEQADAYKIVLERAELFFEETTPRLKVEEDRLQTNE